MRAYVQRAHRNRRRLRALAAIVGGLGLALVALAVTSLPGALRYLRQDPPDTLAPAIVVTVLAFGLVLVVGALLLWMSSRPREPSRR